MRHVVVAFVCLAPCLAQQGVVRFTGQILGNLKGEDGTPVAGGFVSLALLPPQTTWTADPSAGGNFQFRGLVDGRYRLCTQAPKSTWLSLCEWGLQPALVTLPTAQPVATVSIIGKKGVALPIRVEGPG